MTKPKPKRKRGKPKGRPRIVEDDLIAMGRRVYWRESKARQKHKKEILDTVFYLP